MSNQFATACHDLLDGFPYPNVQYDAIPTFFQSSEVTW
jgi:hypothetical protein